MALRGNANSIFQIGPVYTAGTLQENNISKIDGAYIKLSGEHRTKKPLTCPLPVKSIFFTVKKIKGNLTGNI